MWQKLNHRGREFYIKIRNGKKHEVYDRSGNLLCRFGQPGAQVKPGTNKGNSYCARSAKIKTTSPWYKSPNYWSRFRWSCVQGKSVERKEYRGKARTINRPPFK